MEPINKNKRIIEYTGELITNKQSESREDRYLKKGCIWVFRVNRNWSRDAMVGGNDARFINHSCNGNCEADEVRGRIFIKALRNIQAGEELTYDYGLVTDEPLTRKLKAEYPCWCGSKQCRGTMLAPKRAAWRKR